MKKKLIVKQKEEEKINEKENFDEFLKKELTIKYIASNFLKSKKISVEKFEKLKIRKLEKIDY